MNFTENLFGRRIIYTNTRDITSRNVVEVLKKAMETHTANSDEIDYLYRVYKGEQDILKRVKKVRPEINNKIVVNHAQEITNFKTGYLLGEPCSYVRRGKDESASEKIERLNDIMFAEDKASFDRELAMWMHICGLGYRMTLPDTHPDEDESPIEMDVLDPRYAFVVYYSGFGRKQLMGVKYIKDDDGELRFSVYTEKMYFEIKDDKIIKRKPRPVHYVPIVEYPLNPERMGAFEPVMSLLNALNTMASNRLDGIEQFIQAIMVFENCDINAELFAQLKEEGALKVKSDPTNPGKVYYLVEQLDQSQAQTLVDWAYEKVLSIVGMPATTKGGTSTSDTGSAVILRDGWQQAEARARDTEQMFKKAEKQFLKIVLRICRDSGKLDLKLAEIETKFSRRNTDNLLTKTQALLHLLQAGVAPAVALATVGLWSDPADVAGQSEPYLKKWDYEEPIADETVQESGENA